MLHFTGDTHGEQGRFYNGFIEYGELGWNENDTLIICGDFGYIFANGPMENAFLDELEKRPYTICFCDGNHENFPAIYSYPVEKWNGGKIHRIRKNVIHLMRGQVYDIDGKKLFSMGGAYSRDKYMRYENLSWWKEELPNDAEYKEAISNLREVGNKVDYIVSHTAPREIIRRMGKYPDAHDMELTGFLEWIMYEVEFEHWYFGHWHTDRDITEKFSALLFTVKDA